MLSELLAEVNKWLFVAALVFFIKGGFMWLITFVLCFIVCYELIRRSIRYATEQPLSADFPRGLPFPIWVHLLIGWIALALAWILATLSPWS